MDKQRVKKLRKPVGPLRSQSTVYEKGREREVIVTLLPECVEVKCSGLAKVHRVTYQQIYLKALANGSGFDPSPRGGRIVRGIR
jgi:hypothetical protein